MQARTKAISLVMKMPMSAICAAKIVATMKAASATVTMDNLTTKALLVWKNTMITNGRRRKMRQFQEGEDHQVYELKSRLCKLHGRNRNYRHGRYAIR